MGTGGHKGRTVFQSIKNHVGVLRPEREVITRGKVIASADLAAKEEAVVTALLGSHNCKKKYVAFFFLWPPSARCRSDVWDRLSSGKTLTEPEA